MFTFLSQNSKTWIVCGSLAIFFLLVFLLFGPISWHTWLFLMEWKTWCMINCRLWMVLSSIREGIIFFCHAVRVWANYLVPIINWDGSRLGLGFVRVCSLRSYTMQPFQSVMFQKLSTRSFNMSFGSFNSYYVFGVYFSYIGCYSSVFHVYNFLSNC